MKKHSIIRSFTPLYYLKKFLLPMKLTASLLLATILQAPAKTSSSATFSIHQADITLGEFFEEVEQNSDYTFHYKANEIDTKERVSIDVTDASIHDLLDEAFAGTGISYSIRNSSIILSRKNAPAGNDIFKRCGIHRIFPL